MVDKFTASPQTEDGFTRIANELFDAILGFGFTQRQMKVLMAIIRKTYGYGKKSDDMSGSQIGKLCQLPRPAVATVLVELDQMGVIFKEAGRFGSLIEINKNYMQWRELGKKEVTSAREGSISARKAYHYTYKVTQVSTGRFYLGVRSCDCHPNQDRYVGSGNWVSNMPKTDLVKEVVASYATREEAEEAEKLLIKQHIGTPGLQNTVLYIATTSTDSVPSTDSVQGVQINSSASTESVQVASTDSVHTKENLSKENQQKKGRGVRARDEITFNEWIDQAKQRGEDAIPEDDAVFAYAREVGLPIEYLRLCWLEFKSAHTDPNRKTKKYKNWNAAFRNAVRDNWYRIWFPNDQGSYGLTTKGVQLEREMRNVQ